MTSKEMSASVFFLLPKTFNENDVSISFEYLDYTNGEEEEISSRLGLKIDNGSRLNILYPDTCVAKYFDETKNSCIFFDFDHYLDHLPSSKDKYNIKLSIKMSENKNLNYIWQVSLSTGDKGLFDKILIPTDKNEEMEVPILFSYFVSYWL
jgi:hypothetical protein